MKIQIHVLTAVLLLIGCAAAVAQDKPAAPAAGSAQTSAAQPQSPVVRKAEALSEAQIKDTHDIAALSQLGQLYNSQHDMQRFTWTLARLTELMPDSGPLKLQLALAYAEQKDLTNSYNTLVLMQGQGFGFDISKDPRFDSIHGTRVWDYIVANMQANAKQFGEGKVAFDLPKGDYLFESIGYDPKRKQFLIGSGRDGKVYLADQSGKLSDFIHADAANGMWAVIDLGVDSAHDKLYVSSAGLPYYKGFNESSFGQAGIFEFQLSTGKFLHKYIFAKNEGGHVLSNMAVGKDGRVYAADGNRKQIFKLDGGELKLLIENPKLTGIRGLALSDNGKTLYLADYALGIFGIDLGKTEAFALARNAEKLVLGGIEGIYYYDGCLIVIENGMVPQRVMRLKLTDDGHGVRAAMPLDVAQPAFSMPTLGTVVGDQLYFIANSQKALYDQYGVVKDPSLIEPARIFRSNLRFAWGQNGIGMTSEIQKAPGGNPVQGADAKTKKQPDANKGADGKQ